MRRIFFLSVALMFALAGAHGETSKQKASQSILPEQFIVKVNYRSNYYYGKWIYEYEYKGDLRGVKRALKPGAGSAEVTADFSAGYSHEIDREDFTPAGCRTSRGLILIVMYTA